MSDVIVRRFQTPGVWSRTTGVPLKETHRAIARGELKTVWIGKRLYVDAADGERYLDSLPAAFDRIEDDALPPAA
jgi:hypothetical protein